MNRLIPLKGATPLFFIAVALLYFAILPKAQAVIPPPDGGYPGFNTAEGQNALFSRTTGLANTAVGWYSLFSNTDGSYNTGVGAGTLLFNVGDQTTGDGTQNTAIGTAALLLGIIVLTQGFGWITSRNGENSSRRHHCGRGRHYREIPFPISLANFAFRLDGNPHLVDGRPAEIQDFRKSDCTMAFTLIGLTSNGNVLHFIRPRRNGTVSLLVGS